MRYASLLLFIALFAQPAHAQVEERKAANVGVVISQLTSEANDARFDDKPWPRSKPDFAQERRLTLPNEELLRVLARRINDDAVVDGYIKWQLLSFDPDFTQATPEVLRNIVNQMPAVGAQPRPKITQPKAATEPFMAFNLQQAVVRGTRVRRTPGSAAGQVDPTLSVVTSGAVLDVQGSFNPNDPRYVTATVRAASAQLVELRRIVIADNRPILDFREALEDRLPVEDGVQLAALLKDVFDRINSGDPTTQSAVERFCRACGASRNDPRITVERRAAIAAQLRKLEAVKTQWVQSVYVKADNTIGSEMRTLEFPPLRLRQALEDLGAAPSADRP